MKTEPESHPPLKARPAPIRPQRPEDGDCCRSDCTNCVFSIYDRDLERWEEAHALWEQEQGIGVGGVGRKAP